MMWSWERLEVLVLCIWPPRLDSWSIWGFSAAILAFDFVPSNINHLASKKVRGLCTDDALTSGFTNHVLFEGNDQTTYSLY